MSNNTFKPLQNFDSLAPTTTKGDLIARDTSTNVRIPVGTNGLFLMAASGSTGGMGWTSPSMSISLTAATMIVLTSGSTFTTGAGALFLKVRMVGGGAGGSGGGTGGGAGSDGSTSIFGLSLICGAGRASGAGGVAGVATGGDLNINGTIGSIGPLISTGSGGGPGANTPLGLGGTNGSANSAGRAPSGYGAGGGGGGESITSAPSQGGGSGAYVEKTFVSPAAAYQYTVGTQGAPGAAGTSGQAGATGAPGVIIIEQHYQ